MKNTVNDAVKFSKMPKLSSPIIYNTYHTFLNS